MNTGLFLLVGILGAVVGGLAVWFWIAGAARDDCDDDHRFI